MDEKHHVPSNIEGHRLTLWPSTRGLLFGEGDAGKALH